jgi:hypothetical protein
VHLIEDLGTAIGDVDGAESPRVFEEQDATDTFNRAIGRSEPMAQRLRPGCDHAVQ